MTHPASRSPGRHGVADMWYDAKGAPTKRAEPGSTKKNPKGSGSRWRAWYVDSEGRERRKSFEDKRFAQKWCDDESDKVIKGTWIAPERAMVAFRDVAEDWIKTKANRKPTTVSGYRRLLDLVVFERWGDTHLNKIHHGEVQEWVNWLSAKAGKDETGFSASRTIQAYQVLSFVLEYAIRTGRLVRNAAKGVELPTKLDAEKFGLTHKQLRVLAEHCKDAATDYSVLTLTLGYCGLRFGEAIALRRRDVTDKRITVRRAVAYVNGTGQVEGLPKSGKVRTVAVPDVVWDRLKPVLPKSPDALVFPSQIRAGANPDENTEWMTLDEYRWRFDKAVTAAKVDIPSGFTPHGLRHTTATLAISAGITNIKALQNLLGHKSAAMTLDVYGHLLSDDIEDVAKLLDKAAVAG